MPPEDLPSQGTQPLSDDAQRKLWFEYLAKLNDRELQSSQAYGFTPWALLALVAAIIYHGVPQIPAFLSTPGAATASLVTLLLEIDVLCFGGISVVALIGYCGPASQSRLLPELNKRAAQVRNWTLRIFFAAVAAMHFIASARTTGFPNARWVLVAFGLLWTINLLQGIWMDLKAAREAKKNKLPLITLSITNSSAQFGSPIAAAVMFPIAVVPLVTLFNFLRAIHGHGLLWVSTLGTATDVLVIIVVLWALFFMAIDSMSRGVFIALERDVILESLPPSEIRARFIREALGSSVGDWLETVYQKRRESFSRIGRLMDSLKHRVQEIEAIDPGFTLERAGRAQKLLDELDAGLNSYLEELKGFLYQLRQVMTVSPNTWERGLLTRMIEQWTAESNQFIGAASSADELRKRLLAHVNPPQ
jgi:hypothetical protein